MGNKHSLQDDLITFKLTSKQFIRDSKKCEKNQAVQKEKLVKAIKDGNMEGARIYGQNVIREKNQALNFLRMASRIDAVASRLETAIRMQDVSKVRVRVLRGSVPPSTHSLLFTGHGHDRQGHVQRYEEHASGPDRVDDGRVREAV